MELGFIGLGKMGMNMVTRLQQGKHKVVAFDRAPELVKKATEVGCVGASSLEDMVSKLSGRRIVWVMVPSGAPTEETVQKVASLLSSGDIVIDGGNSNFHDDARRSAELKKKNIHYVDIGTSGGVWGLKNGYCMMAGGEKADVDHLKPILDTLAPPNGWGYMGKAGAGHYVKMVHNAIEYSMMQGYAEGFELMKKSEFNLDIAGISELWMQGSVVRSWLLELTAGFLKENPNLDGLKGYVQDSGEGRWTLIDAIDQSVPVPTLAAALFTRFRSRQDESFAEKMLAAMRNAFGGHAVKRS
ncbi:MAG TPA: decarboxylating 6-phosphogluconate dehydrogenase [Polyangia bacterium]|jgi:6-phosphogluconate dehydrogenase|nr:decarboxylating 6-phosphogluconate dehydrogenase [Polyangia bacterium]